MKVTRKNNFRKVIQDIDGSLQNIKRLKDSLALLYQENSKLTPFALMKTGEEIGRFSNPYVLERAAQPYKCFPTAKTFEIEEYIIEDNFSANLFDVIRKRRSGRNYSSYQISLNEIANILFYGYGITHEENISTGRGVWSYRSVPSGGALYPLEIYFYVHHAVIPDGIYHFRPDINVIELIRENYSSDEIKSIIYGEPYVDMTNYSCIMIISSVFDRILMKYGERGYRFILQEVGFVAQNISLTCEGLGLSSCMIGSYLDDNLNSLIDADGILESVQSVIVVGKNSKS